MVRRDPPPRYCTNLSALSGPLHEIAAAAGFATLSLSVGNDNPARLLCDRQGYVVVTLDDGGLRMVKKL